MMILLIFVPSMIAAAFWLLNPATLRTVWSIIPVFTAIAGVMGAQWVAGRRKKLVSSEHFAATKQQIEAIHKARTGTPLAQVIPLTTASAEGGMFEALR